MSIAAAAMAFTGCSKDSTEPGSEAPETITITVVASDKIENAPAPSTRTHYDETTQKIHWDGDGSTESIYVLEKSTSVALAASTNCTVTDGKASFSVTLPTTTASELTYAAVYPASALVVDKYPDLTRIKVNLPASQTPRAAGFDPAADLMMSLPITRSTQPGELSLRFGRVAALAKMTVTNLNFEPGESVKTVGFTATGKALAGRNYLDLSAGKINQLAYINVSDRILMDFTNVSNIDAASFPAWFTCLPCSLSAGDSFTLVITSTANKTYTKQVTLSGAQTIAFTSGDITTFSVNMAGIQGEEQASDAKVATLTYEEIKGLSLSYNTPIDYTNAGGRWTVQASKGTNPVGIQLNSNETGKNSHIKLPIFSNPISSVTVETAKAGTSLTLYAANNTESQQYATITTPVEGKNTFTFSEAVNTAYLKVSGATVITSVTVTVGPTIVLSNITDVAAIGTTDATATYKAIAFTAEDDTAVTAISGAVSAASVDNATKTLTYSVSPNYTGTAREGSITLSSANNETEITITVSQQADKFEAAPESIILSGDINATADFTLISDFTVGVPSVSDPTKFSISGPVANVYTVTALADGGAAEAELGTVTLTRTGDNKTVVVTVKQAAKGATIEQYTQITSISEFTEGDYVITVLMGGKYYALPIKPAANSRPTGVEITVTNNTITSADAQNFVWTITNTGDFYTLYDGTNYLCGGSSTNLAYGSDKSKGWIISGAANGTFDFASTYSSTTATRYLLLNSPTFGNYAANSSYIKITLFKKN